MAIVAAHFKRIKTGFFLIANGGQRCFVREVRVKRRQLIYKEENFPRTNIFIRKSGYIHDFKGPVVDFNDTAYIEIPLLLKYVRFVESGDYLVLPGFETKVEVVLLNQQQKYRFMVSWPDDCIKILTIKKDRLFDVTTKTFLFPENTRVYFRIQEYPRT